MKTLSKIPLFIHNFLAVRIFNKRIAKLLWNEVDYPIFRWNREYSRATYFSKTGKPFCIRLQKSDVLTALLHEIGHLKDAKKYGGNYIKQKHEHAEKKAWKNAICLSRRYMLPLNVPTAIKWLSTYNGTKYQCLENLKNERC